MLTLLSGTQRTAVPLGSEPPATIEPVKLDLSPIIERNLKEVVAGRLLLISPNLTQYPAPVGIRAFVSDLLDRWYPDQSDSEAGHPTGVGASDRPNFCGTAASVAETLLAEVITAGSQLYRGVGYTVPIPLSNQDQQADCEPYFRRHLGPLLRALATDCPIEFDDKLEEGIQHCALNPALNAYGRVQVRQRPSLDPHKDGADSNSSPIRVSAALESIVRQLPSLDLRSLSEAKACFLGEYVALTALTEKALGRWEDSRSDIAGYLIQQAFECLTDEVAPAAEFAEKTLLGLDNAEALSLRRQICSLGLAVCARALGRIWQNAYSIGAAGDQEIPQLCGLLSGLVQDPPRIGSLPHQPTPTTARQRMQLFADSEGILLLAQRFIAIHPEWKILPAPVLPPAVPPSVLNSADPTRTSGQVVLNSI